MSSSQTLTLAADPLAVPHRIDRLVERPDPGEVHLGRRDARVPERVPHHVEGRPGADEVDREGVAQPVRVDAALDARLGASLGNRCRT